MTESLRSDWSNVSPDFHMGEGLAPTIAKEVLPMLFGHGLVGGRLLDYGCWDGRNTIPLAESGHFSEVIGVDVESWAGDKMEHLRSLQIPNLKVMGVEPYQKLPFQLASFDVGLAWRIPHNIFQKSDRVVFFSNMLDMLARGGIFVASSRVYKFGDKYITEKVDRDEWGSTYLARRFPTDIVRFYYQSSCQMEEEMIMQKRSSARLVFISRFTEYEYRKEGDRQIVDEIPCVAVGVKKI